MKKIKILLSIAVVFILSGCTVKYDLSISPDVINEKITISEEQSLVDESEYDEIFNNTYSTYTSKTKTKYITSKEKENSKINYILKQNYNIRNFKPVRAFSECFDAYNLVESSDINNQYILQTSKGFNCMVYSYATIDSYEINIQLKDYDVINNNASDINGDIYSWKINNTNAADFYISLEFKEKNDVKQNSSDDIVKNNINSSSIVGISIILLISICIIVIIILKINRKNNKL